VTIKRTFDVVVASVLGLICLVPCMLIALVIRLTSAGPVIYWSDRVGQNNRIFRMPKFRTMTTNAPEVATHLMSSPQDYVTSVGDFLRKTSLDELPQLWSVLRGDMSLVGPRPALFNQEDLVALRSRAGVDQLMPGLTGWAQVNGRDELTIDEKVDLDREYLARAGLNFDLKIIWMTLFNTCARRGVSH
jgi:O-antigen biosynthesis protein WbqP